MTTTGTTDSASDTSDQPWSLDDLLEACLRGCPGPTLRTRSSWLVALHCAFIPRGHVVLGGQLLKPVRRDDDAVTDALRFDRVCSWAATIADLETDPREILRAFGELVTNPEYTLDTMNREGRSWPCTLQLPLDKCDRVTEASSPSLEAATRCQRESCLHTPLLRRLGWWANSRQRLAATIQQLNPMTFVAIHPTTGHPIGTLTLSDVDNWCGTVAEWQVEHEYRCLGVGLSLLKIASSEHSLDMLAIPEAMVSTESAFNFVRYVLGGRLGTWGRDGDGTLSWMIDLTTERRQLLCERLGRKWKVAPPSSVGEVSVATRSASIGSVLTRVSSSSSSSSASVASVTSARPREEADADGDTEE